MYMEIDIHENMWQCVCLFDGVVVCVCGRACVDNREKESTQERERELVWARKREDETSNERERER